jgi:heptosyltransferase II
MKSNVKKILVRGTNWLGDAVMTIPAMLRLRESFPNAQITLLAPPRAAEIFTGFPQVDEIVPYRRKEEGKKAFVETMQRLRRERFDLAILFQNAFEAALLSFLGNAKLRIGFDTQGRGFLLTHKLKTPLPNRHQTNDYLDLVIEAERICFQDRPQTRENPLNPSDPWSIPAMTAQPSQLSSATELLHQFGIQNGNNKLIVLNAGATNSRAKCWPENYFAELADRMVDEQNAKIILIGAGAERENAERVIAQMKHPSKALNLAGKSTIPELIGILAKADLVITNDTGPAHVAAALSVPTLTIFGPTNEFETAPLGKNSALIRAAGIECERCMHRECPIDHRCMTRITAAEVFSKSINLMQA